MMSVPHSSISRLGAVFHGDCFTSSFWKSVNEHAELMVEPLQDGSLAQHILIQHVQAWIHLVDQERARVHHLHARDI